MAAKFDLKKGLNLSKSDIHELLFREERRRVKEKAYRYLAGRAHSKKELRDKLLRKGFEAELIEQVLKELTDQKYLDDQAFAMSFAKSRVLNKPIGVRLLRRDLMMKGISKNLIDEAIRETYRSESEEDLAQRLFEKRKNRYGDLEDIKTRKKLFDFLLRRGFAWEVVKRVVVESSNERK